MFFLAIIFKDVRCNKRNYSCKVIQNNFMDRWHYEYASELTPSSKF